MKWTKERDLLIAQTMAFVQSVTGKTAGELNVAPVQPSSEPRSSDAFANALENVTSIIDPPKPVAAKDILARDARPEASSARVFAPSETPPKALPPLEDFPRDVPISRADIRSDYRAEILNRVASFRANQQRFHRERDEFFSSTLARIHASIDGEAEPARLRK